MCSQKVRTANAALHARAIKIFDKAMLKSLIRLLEQYAPFVLLVSYAFSGTYLRFGGSYKTKGAYCSSSLSLQGFEKHRKLTAKRLIVPLRGTMVSRRETIFIKIFDFKEAQACKGKALDCFPRGNHGPPKGDNQGLCPCMVTDASSNKNYV
jgi:hypothetical protein